MKKSIDLNFYRSQATLCSYLPDRWEEQVYLLLNREQMLPLADQLNKVGFRRSMNSVYIPACAGCQACRSVRIKVDNFRLSRNQRRLRRRNADLHFRREPLTTSGDNFLMFHNYLMARHPESNMNDIDQLHFRQLVETAPENAFALCVYCNDQLLGMMMVDHFSDGFSAVYSFYDVDAAAQRSIGVLMILELTAWAKSYGLPYVYLGYYIAGSQKMAYKVRFQPMEIFDWSHMRWLDFDAAAHEQSDEPKVSVSYAMPVATIFDNILTPETEKTPSEGN